MQIIRTVILCLAIIWYVAASRTIIDISSSWMFHLGDLSLNVVNGPGESNWTIVDIPHTYDNDTFYYRGIVWYKKNYKSDPSLANKKVILQFDGVSIVADVTVNGKNVGQHHGAFAIFRFDVTSVWNYDGENTIIVKVDNTFSPTELPYLGHFTKFGGIYRRVHVMGIERTHIDVMNYASSGLFIRQKDVSRESVNLNITTKVMNDSPEDKDVVVVVDIVDQSKVSVKTLEGKYKVPANGSKQVALLTSIAEPHLWHGRVDPYLYSVKATIMVSGQEVDSITQPLGIRYFRLDPQKGFFLNDKPYRLHGVNMHQDRFGKGWAVSIEDRIEDMSFVQDIGATALRLSHYQHDQIMYDVADKMGIVVWAEIAFIDYVAENQEFYDHAQLALIELIRQNFNHPSIVFWSIANELHNNPDPGPLLKILNKIVKNEDPSRISTEATCCIPEVDPNNLITDTRGYNRYFGWFEGVVTDLGPFLNKLHMNNPNLTIGVSEYGAGGSIYQHESNARQPHDLAHFHPEEYQTLLHETQWQAMDACPFLWGIFMWNIFDFADFGRNQGDFLGHVDLGLVTYDRKVKKDAYWYYKVNWSSEKLIYITERRYNRRNIPVTDIRVYSNLPNITLSINGKQLEPTTSKYYIFKWSKVQLVNGNNKIIATGENLKDEVEWMVSPDIRINAGARMPHMDHENQYWDVDHYNVGGKEGSVIGDIKNATDVESYLNYRSGNSFLYSIPVQNGVYKLTLMFLEPNKTSVGKRMFDVVVNDHIVLHNFDIFKIAQGINIATKVEIDNIKVDNGKIMMKFLGTVDFAIVSAFSFIMK
jgi:beta-galactosidase